jgi:chorismate-pyruvate lyase
MKTTLALALSLALALPAPAREPLPRWPDAYQSRVEILALLQSLNADILAASSATRSLESWCGSHHMADEAKVVATQVTGASKPPSAEQLARLDVQDASHVRYRRVELRCGTHLLSEADNWYVPSRLTPEMNALLETTTTPFGKVVAPLHPYRRTFAAVLLWSPLPAGWEQRGTTTPAAHPRRALAMPKELLQHRAVLYTEGHVPFSEVVETYQSQLFDFTRGAR